MAYETFDTGGGQQPLIDPYNSLLSMDDLFQSWEQQPDWFGLPTSAFAATQGAPSPQPSASTSAKGHAATVGQLVSSLDTSQADLQRPPAIVSPSQVSSESSIATSASTPEGQQHYSASPSAQLSPPQLPQEQYGYASDQHVASPPSVPLAPSQLQTGNNTDDKLMPFIEKLSFLLANPARFGDCLRWDASGTTFVLAHANPRLQAEILPRIFSHRNVPSFTRQLNIYAFHRITQAELLSLIDAADPSSLPIAEYSGWRHEGFSRESTEADLRALKPRPSKARVRRKLEKQRAQDERLASHKHASRAHVQQQLGDSLAAHVPASSPSDSSPGSSVAMQHFPSTSSNSQLPPLGASLPRAPDAWLSSQSFGPSDGGATVLAAPPPPISTRTSGTKRTSFEAIGGAADGEDEDLYDFDDPSGLSRSPPQRRRISS